MLRVSESGLQPAQMRAVAPKYTQGESCCGPTAKNITMVALLSIGVVATAIAALSVLGYLSISSAIGSFSTTAAIVTLVAGGTITVGSIVGLMFYNLQRDSDRDNGYTALHDGRQPYPDADDGDLRAESGYGRGSPSASAHNLPHEASRRNVRGDHE